MPDLSKSIIMYLIKFFLLVAFFGTFATSLDSCADIVASVSNVGNCNGPKCEIDVRFSFGLNLENPHKICLKAKTNDVFHDFGVNITLAEHHVVNNLINCYHSDEFKVITKSKCSCNTDACNHNNCPIGQSFMENDYAITYNQHFSRECVPPIINWFVDHYTAVLKLDAKMSGSYRYYICEIGKKTALRNSVEFRLENRTELINYLEDENKFVSLGKKIKVLDFRVDEDYNEYEGKVFIHDRTDKGNFYIIDKRYVNLKGEFDPKKIGFFKTESPNESTKALLPLIQSTVVDCPKQKVNFKYDIAQNSELLSKFEKYQVNDLNDKVIFDLNPEENLIYPKSVDNPANKYIYDRGFYYYDNNKNDYVVFGFDSKHDFIFSNSNWNRYTGNNLWGYSFKDNGWMDYDRTIDLRYEKVKCQQIQYGSNANEGFFLCQAPNLLGDIYMFLQETGEINDGAMKVRNLFPNAIDHNTYETHFYLWPGHQCKKVVFGPTFLLEINDLPSSTNCHLKNVELPQELRARIDKGNFELVVSLEKTEIQFYEENVIPSIEKCSFSNNKLIVNARSTSSPGDSVLTTSPNSVFQDRISLTNVLTDFEVPPTQNFKGELTVTLQNRDKKATCKVDVDTKFDPTDFGIKTKPSLNEELLNVAKGNSPWYYTLLLYLGIGLGVLFIIGCLGFTVFVLAYYELLESTFNVIKIIVLFPFRICMIGYNEAMRLKKERKERNKLKV